MHCNTNILLSMFTFSKEIKKHGLIEEALPVIRERASAFGKSLRFRENVIGGDEPADSPYTVTCDLRNISLWEKIRRKKVRTSKNKSVWGIFFFVQGLRSVSKRCPKSGRGGSFSGKTSAGNEVPGKLRLES